MHLLKGRSAFSVQFFHFPIRSNECSRLTNSKCWQNTASSFCKNLCGILQKICICMALYAHTLAATKPWQQVFCRPQHNQRSQIPSNDRQHCTHCSSRLLFLCHSCNTVVRFRTRDLLFLCTATDLPNTN